MEEDNTSQGQAFKQNKLQLNNKQETLASSTSLSDELPLINKKNLPANSVSFYQEELDQTKKKNNYIWIFKSQEKYRDDKTLLINFSYNYRLLTELLLKEETRFIEFLLDFINKVNFESFTETTIYNRGRRKVGLKEVEKKLKEIYFFIKNKKENAKNENFDKYSLHHFLSNFIIDLNVLKKYTFEDEKYEKRKKFLLNNLLQLKWRLVCIHSAMANHIALIYVRQNNIYNLMEDLTASGLYGINISIYKFDAKRGNKFITLATWWMKYYISTKVHEYISEKVAMQNESVKPNIIIYTSNANKRDALYKEIRYAESFKKVDKKLESRTEFYYNITKYPNIVLIKKFSFEEMEELVNNMKNPVIYTDSQSLLEQTLFKCPVHQIDEFDVEDVKLDTGQKSFIKNNNSNVSFDDADDESSIVPSVEYDYIRELEGERLLKTVLEKADAVCNENELKTLAKLLDNGVVKESRLTIIINKILNTKMSEEGEIKKGRKKKYTRTLEDIMQFEKKERKKNRPRRPKGEIIETNTESI